MALLLLCLAGGIDARAQYFPFGKNRVQYSAPDWFVLDAGPFDVYYPDGSEELARFAAAVAEAMLPEVRGLFGDAPRGRIPLLVYPDQNAFLATNAVDLPPLSDAIGGVTELFKNRVLVPFTGDHREFARVLRHELVHAVVNDVYFGGSMQAALRLGVGSRIPLWFNEGLAEYVAFSGDARSDAYVRDAFMTGRPMALDRLDGFDAYRGGQAFWAWFDGRFGRAAVAAVLDSLRTAGTARQALERATGLAMDTLSAAWRRDVGRRVRLDAAGREEPGRALVTREHGLHHATPALSPDGDRLAYVSTTDGVFHVYVAPVRGNGPPVRVLETRRSTDFEAVRVLTPGLAWSGNGQRLAVAVKRGRVESVALVTLGGGVRHVDVPGVSRILSLAWHPTEDRLALAAVHGGRSDLFLLDLSDALLTRLTDDGFDDHAPDWSPDGRRIVWHSNRGPNAGTLPGMPPVMSVQAAGAPYDLYVIEPRSGHAERLTDTAWDEWRAQWSGDGREVLFLSDRNGIVNVDAIAVGGGWRRPSRPVTDAPSGILDWSEGGGHAALVTFFEGTTHVRILERVAVRRGRPAGEGVSPNGRSSAQALRIGRPAAGALPARDFAAELPSDGASSSRDPGTRSVEARQGPAARPYRIDFSTDLLYGAAGYDPLFGAQGLTQMTFSDLLGDHRLRAATNLVLDLRRSDYVVTYEVLRRRMDWAVSVSHTARYLSDRTGPEAEHVRFRRFAGQVSVSWPLSTFDRIDAHVTIAGGQRLELDSGAPPALARTRLVPRIAFTRDVTTPGFLYPEAGRRLAFAASAGTRFVTLLADWREYRPLGGGTLAVRVSAAAEAGRGPWTYFTAGVLGWMNDRVDRRGGLPVRTADDFLFAVPIAPVRGFAMNTRSGPAFGLVNAEWRRPIVGRILPVLGLYGLEGRIFVDGGAVWSRPSPGASGRPTLLGSGFGFRALVLGLPIGVDRAWAIGDRRRGQTYVSIGLDY